MKVHELKTVQPYYDLVSKGQKKFELRKNDRDFKTGDILILNEFDPITEYLTGYNVAVRVTGVLKDYSGLIDGYCILSISEPI